MAFADGLVLPQLRRSIRASRALASAVRAPEVDVEDRAPVSGLMPLAAQALTGFMRVLEADLNIQVRFIADPADPELGLPDAKPSGAGVGAPVRLASGHILGMLCFSRSQSGGQLDERDVRRLEMSARLAARLIDGADAHGIAC